MTVPSPARLPVRKTRYTASAEGAEVEVEVSGASATVARTGEEMRFVEEPGGAQVILSGGGRLHRLFAFRRDGPVWEIYHQGRSFRVEVEDEQRLRGTRRQTGRSPSGHEPLRAPMPGLVLRVDAREGAEVREGQGLLIIEAMKMENELSAHASGRIRRVRVSAGQSVKRGQVLIEFHPGNHDARRSGDEAP